MTRLQRQLWNLKGLAMKNKSFNVGDVVRAVSGGPKMTIERIRPEATDKVYVDCLWFTCMNDELRWGTFLLSSLKGA